MPGGITMSKPAVFQIAEGNIVLHTFKRTFDYLYTASDCHALKQQG